MASLLLCDKTSQDDFSHFCEIHVKKFCGVSYPEKKGERRPVRDETHTKEHCFEKQWHNFEFKRGDKSNCGKRRLSSRGARGLRGRNRHSQDHVSAGIVAAIPTQKSTASPQTPKMQWSSVFFLVFRCGFRSEEHCFEKQWHNFETGTQFRNQAGDKSRCGKRRLSSRGARGLRGRNRHSEDYVLAGIVAAIPTQKSTASRSSGTISQQGHNFEVRLNFEMKRGLITRR